MVQGVQTIASQKVFNSTIMKIKSILPPIVGSWNSKNSSLTNLTTKHDLPTAESPSNTSLKCHARFALIPSKILWSWPIFTGKFYPMWAGAGAGTFWLITVLTKDSFTVWHSLRKNEAFSSEVIVYNMLIWTLSNNSFPNCRGRKKKILENY
jgi:hypothetical protein